ncbi:DUF1569 domain-containing protein [Aliikangiella sp. IMCC44632]
MRRRQLITGVLAASGLTALAGYAYLSSAPQHAHLSISQAKQRLAAYALAPKIISHNQWNPAQTLTHLAQSIEFSMQGYPIHHSVAFKQTIGPLAFLVFKRHGKMRHNLTEVIPGAPQLTQLGSAKATQFALARLINALNVFERYKGELQPHFAYGTLSHADYQLAHAMHIDDHLQALTINPS